MLQSFEDKTKSYGDKENYGTHGSIRKLYGKPQLDRTIGTAVRDKRGRLLITSEHLAVQGGSLLIMKSVDRERYAGQSSGAYA